MSLAPIKAALKKNPVAYKLLFPIVNGLRKARAQRLQPGWDAALEEFRSSLTELSEKASDPVFVKVGANDGLSGDPCSDILLQYKWRGVLVEPVPYCVERLKKNFSDTNKYAIEQVAIGNKAGETTFYYVDRKAKEEMPDIPGWYDQLGSFDREHINKHLHGRLDKYILEAKVEVQTLTTLLERNKLEQIDLLHVDTEGFDYQVIQTLDFNAFKPQIIFIEKQHLSAKDKKAMQTLFTSNGYAMQDCGSDYFAMLER